jgi:hypothetical protein
VERELDPQHGRRQSPSPAVRLRATPFLLLLLPEGFLLPRNFAGTVTGAILVTALLAVGTALWTVLAVVVLRILRGGGLRPAPAPRVLESKAVRHRSACRRRSLG